MAVLRPSVEVESAHAVAEQQIAADEVALGDRWKLDQLPGLGLGGEVNAIGDGPDVGSISPAGRSIVPGGVSMGESMVLRAADMRLIDDLFGMSSGWVLDFTNATFDDFFRNEVGVDIYDDAYAVAGGSKGKRLRAFLQRGQPPAIVKALHGLWECREAERLGKGETDKVAGGRERLNALLVRLGGEQLPGDPTVGSAPQPTATGPSTATLDRLETTFTALNAMDERPQARGYAFETFLKDWFDAWGLDARSSFRTVGEQIDGSFRHDGDTYLIEAKWQNAKTDAAMLHGFHGKLLERPDWARGLYVSYASFTDQGFAAFTSRRLIMMDGMDIFLAVHRRIDLDRIIAEKVRHFTERREPFAKVADLFPA